VLTRLRDLGPALEGAGEGVRHAGAVAGGGGAGADRAELLPVGYGARATGDLAPEPAGPDGPFGFVVRERDTQVTGGPQIAVLPSQRPRGEDVPFLLQLAPATTRLARK
jgi:hypothetical protein